MNSELLTTLGVLISSIGLPLLVFLASRKKDDSELGQQMLTSASDWLKRLEHRIECLEEDLVEREVGMDVLQGKVATLQRNSYEDGVNITNLQQRLTHLAALNNRLRTVIGYLNSVIIRSGMKLPQDYHEQVGQFISVTAENQKDPE